MINLKYKIHLETYNLTKKGDYAPYIIIGFSENVNSHENIPTSNRSSIYDSNSYELFGYVEKNQLDNACLLLYVFHPQESCESTDSYVYQRVCEKKIEYCTNLEKKNYKISCLNKLKEEIAKIILEIFEIKNDTLTNKSQARTRGHNNDQKYMKRFKMPYDDQRIYEKKMYEFINNNFKYIWEDTKHMTLFNDNFSFFGNTPFYHFEDITIKETNEEYWQKLFDQVLFMNYMSETNTLLKSGSKKEFWNSLSTKEKLSILIDMIILPSSASYYLSDFVQRVKRRTEDIKYVEDFCVIFNCWSGDCEDLMQFAMVMFKMFKFCKFKNEELKALQTLTHYYILFFTLCCADRASTGSKKKSLSGHMCGLLLRKGLVRDNTVIRDENDKKIFDTIFKEYSEPENLPDILIVEGTGFVKGCMIDKTVPRLDTKKWGMQESIKERITISKDSMPFYLYAFEVLTNHFIDHTHSLNIQSFILTYKPSFNNKKGTKYNESQRFYGVEIRDIFENSDMIQFVPTPKIDEDLISTTKKISKMKLQIPPCFLKDGDFLSKYHADNVHPIVSNDELSAIDSFVQKNYDIRTNEMVHFDKKSERLDYMLVPPRNLISTLKNIPKNTRIPNIQKVQLFSDLFVYVVWIHK